MILWDVTSSKRLNTLVGYTSPVWSVAFSPAGDDLLASGSDNNAVTLWDVSAALNPGAAAVSGMGIFTMFDSGLPATRGQEPGNDEYLYLAKKHFNPVANVIFSPDGQTLVSANQDGPPVYWKLHP